MKTIKQLEKQKLEIEKQIEKLKAKEQLKDFQEFTFKGKKFRIVKWENKPYGDLIDKNFNCKLWKNFRLAEFQEFNEAIEEKAFILEVWKYYITKHFNSLQWKKEYCLSRGCLNRYSGLSSNNSDLSDSNVYGRVVLCEDLK